jgi:uncharacterized protein YjiS (DUF1127 family)
MNLSEDTWLASKGRQQVASPAIPWLVRLQAGISRLRAGWRTRRQRTRDVASLYTFSDRELWDLGLSRSDITGISNGTYRRD